MRAAGKTWADLETTIQKDKDDALLAGASDKHTRWQILSDEINDAQERLRVARGAGKDSSDDAKAGIFYKRVLGGVSQRGRKRRPGPLFRQKSEDVQRLVDCAADSAKRRRNIVSFVGYKFRTGKQKAKDSKARCRRLGLIHIS
jgi:hypothetical protein